MLSLEEVSKYLPKYLSPESTEELFNELAQFPDNINARLYTSQLIDKNNLFQGDGICCLPHISLPDSTVYEAPAMIVSNTCDNEPHIRFIPISIQYTPILKLRKTVKLMRDNGIDEEKIEEFISLIKKQRISQIFYLPVGSGVAEESLIFFDKIASCENNIEKDDIPDMRLFSLSNFGIYLFILKLSIHFTRIQEKVDRNKGIIS